MREHERWVKHRFLSSNEKLFLLQSMFIPIRRFLAQEIPRSIRAIDLKPSILRNQFSSRIPSNVMHQGANGMNFQIALSQTGNLGCDDEAEEHRALDMVEGEIS